MQRKVVKQLGNLDDDALSEKCDRVYAVMDSNGSGGIDFTEFQKGMLDCWGVQFSTKIIFNLFSKYDTDGSGMISADEFLALCKELLQLSLEHKLSDDADASSPGDGEGEGGGASALQGAGADSPDLGAASAAEAQGSRGAPKTMREIATAGIVHQSQSVMLTQLARQEVEREGGAARQMRHVLLLLVDPSTRAGQVFSRAILMCIMVSTLALAIDNHYIGAGSPVSVFLQCVEYTVNAAFTLEFGIKIVALGWRGYFVSIWNKINFFIVVTSDLDMVLSAVLESGSGSQVAGLLGIFRIFRVLRPLRIAAEQVPRASLMNLSMHADLCCRCVVE